MKKIKVFMFTLLCMLILALPILTYASVQKISTHADNLGNDDVEPTIASDCCGNSYVTWKGYDGTDWEIYWMKIDSSGTPGTVQKISTHEDNLYDDDWNPQIGIDCFGNSYVVWGCSTGLKCDVYWVKVDSSGVAGEVQKVSTHPDNLNRCDYSQKIAVDDAGNSYITWMCWGVSNLDIYWVKIDYTGLAGDIQKIATHPDNLIYDDRKPEIGIDVLGNSYVIWRGWDGSDWEIYWVKVDASGVPGTVEMISTHTDNINSDDFRHKIAVDSVGNSYVTWRGRHQDREIYWVKIDSQGTVGTVQKISTHEDNIDGHEDDPQIGVDCRGNSYVVWEGEDETDLEIYWVKIDSSGTPGAVQKISTHAGNLTNDDDSPIIAVNSSGNSFVTWQGWDGNDWEIYQVKIDSSGTPGTVQKISTHADNINKDDHLPYIRANCCGDSYVTWYGWDGTDFEIYFVIKEY